MNFDEMYKDVPFETNEVFEYTKIPFTQDQDVACIIGLNKNNAQNLKIENLIIPEEINGCSVIGVFNSSFEGLPSLKRVTIPDKCIYVGENAFKNCINLEEVDLGKGCFGIGERCFLNCFSLKKIIFSPVLEEIKTEAFKDCFSLLHLNLPDSLKHIGKYAFSHCSKLTKVSSTDKSEMLEIDEGAFVRCVSLKSVILPHALIDSYCFAFCSKLKEAYVESLTENGDCFFMADVALEEISIFAPIENYRPNYFYGCRKLIHMYGLNDIDFQFFSNYARCFEYKKFGYTLNHFNTISILYYRGNEKDIVIPNKIDGIEVNEISCGAFYSNEDIETVTCNENLQQICDDAFRNCTALLDIKLNEKLIHIADRSFENCIYLSHIDFPNKLTYIGNSAFRHCVNLSEAQLPDSVLVLSNLAFSLCTNIKNFHVPVHLQVLEMGTFDECENLKSLNIPADVFHIDGELKITLDTLTVDEENQIYDSRNNCNAIMNSGANQLMYASRKTEIPIDCESIEAKAFANIEGISNLYIPASVEEIKGDTFSYDENMTIHIEDGSVLSNSDFGEFPGKIVYDEPDVEA